jgi:hypothetical protein
MYHPNPPPASKRGRLPAPALLALLLCLIAPLFAAAPALAASQVMVTVKQTTIRAEPAFYAKSIATLRYTDQLQVVEERQGWLRVRHGSKIGWVHSSAVSGTGATASGDSAMAGLGSALAALSGQSSKQGSGQQFTERDVALAGKGFNTKVEGEYRKQHPGANCAAVDKMEKHRTRPRPLLRFAERGGSDLATPTPFGLDRVLYRIFASERNRVAGRGLPIGISLLTAARPS